MKNLFKEFIAFILIFVFGVVTITLATTIGTNVTTDGTLNVSGLTTLGNASSTLFSVSSNSWLATTTITGDGTALFTIERTDGDDILTVATTKPDNGEGLVVISEPDSGGTYHGLIVQRASDSSQVGPGITNRRARGTLSAPTAVVADDEIWGHYFMAYDGFEYDYAARMVPDVQSVNGACTDTTNCFIGGRLWLSTNTGDSEASHNPGIIIDQDQNIMIGEIDTTASAGVGNGLGILTLRTRTAPTASPADKVSLYSDDISIAGDAGLNIRTENGNIFSMGEQGFLSSLYDNSSTPQAAATSTKMFLHTQVLTDGTGDGLCTPTTACIVLPAVTTFGLLEVFAYESSVPTTLWGKFMILSNGTVNLLKDSGGTDEMASSTGKTIDDTALNCSGTNNTHLCVMLSGGAIKIYNDTGNTVTTTVNFIYN